MLKTTPGDAASTNRFFLIVCLIMLIMAFVRCYLTTYDLFWASESDFDRDISFVQTILDGHYGQDPNMLGAYNWYNPLLFFIEALIVKISGLPIHVVLVRAGAFLNIFGPLCFVAMMRRFFDEKVAAAGLLSFLFLASGNVLAGATYSAWLFPIFFGQCFFYLGLIFCYQAFSTQKINAFLLLGIVAGLNFLTQTAPALLLILILVVIQGGNVWKAIRSRNYALVKTYLLQGLVTFLPFVIVSSPFLYYVYGKYHFHFVNRQVSEYVDWWMVPGNLPKLLKEAVNVQFLIAVVGFIWFYRNFKEQLVRKIILSWLFLALFLYGYTTMLPWFEKRNILLPVTVPSFHYFFYLKALQSVFFGLGFVYLVGLVFNWLKNRIGSLSRRSESPGFRERFVIGAVLLYSVVYFPVYWNRMEFVVLRKMSIKKAADLDKTEVYDYIVRNIPANKVIVCDMETSFFPAMPTARKLVSIYATFSNPYVDYNQREADRQKILRCLQSGRPQEARDLLRQYQVEFYLARNADLGDSSALPALGGKRVFQNPTYSIFSLSY
ncbi:MAG TPA: hypothetical protein VMI35_05385 [Puia sp.]|nr:hypothetical protein [Puia sp.]